MCNFGISLIRAFFIPIGIRLVLKINGLDESTEIYFNALQVSFIGKTFNKAKGYIARKNFGASVLYGLHYIKDFLCKSSVKCAKMKLLEPIVV